MYSYEERLRAVKLYIKYDHSLSAVIRELGYPSHQALLQWYREYITRGDLHAKCVRRRRRCKYTMEQRRAAVAYYQEYGQNLARTVKKLGYPSRATLFNWLKEDINRSTHPCHSGAPVVKFQQDQKEQAVIDLCIRESSAEKIASKHGVSRASLYKWKDELLGRERAAIVIRLMSSKHRINTLRCAAKSRPCLQKRIAAMDIDEFMLT